MVEWIYWQFITSEWHGATVIPRGLTEVQKIMWNWQQQNIFFSPIVLCIYLFMYAFEEMVIPSWQFFWQLSTAGCQRLVFIMSQVPFSYCAVYTRCVVKWGGDTWMSHSDHLIKHSLGVVAELCKGTSGCWQCNIQDVCDVCFKQLHLNLFYISSYTFPLKCFFL